MQQGYFATAWSDIKNSPGWVGKMFLLSLIAFIPIFGQIAVFGYLYGWARNVAWGIQSPLPQRIFGNEDGKLYRRGFFIYVLSLVFGLVIGLLGFIVMLPFLGMIFSLVSGDRSSFGIAGFFLILSLFLCLLLFAVSIAAGFFLWVGYMRISIYDRLSAGFQLKKIWKMMRKDFGGLLRILGMVLITSIIIGIILQVIVSILGVTLGISSLGLHSAFYGGSSSSVGVSFFMIFLTVVLILALIYLQTVSMMWVGALSARALGYWTRQFDVAQWRGQDDPMPFEMQQIQTAPAQSVPSYHQTYQTPSSVSQVQSTQSPAAGQTYYQDPMSVQEVVSTQVSSVQEASSEADSDDASSVSDESKS